MDTRKTKTTDLAGYLGVTESGVRGWYTGFSRPDIDKIAAICKYFDVTSDYLLGLTQSDCSLAESLYNDRERRKKEFRNDLAHICNLADSLIYRLRWLSADFKNMED